MSAQGAAVAARASGAVGVGMRRRYRMERVALDVMRWAQMAQPGERVCYHEGDDVREAIGSNAMLAHNSGLVFLAQRRVGDIFQYEATRVSDRTARTLRIGNYRGDYRG